MLSQLVNIRQETFKEPLQGEWPMYSPPSPLHLHYADTSSTVFADRPIRPLPKRRLRSRLTVEDADLLLRSSERPPSQSSKPNQSLGNSNPIQEPDSYRRSVDHDVALDLNSRHLVRDDRESYQFKGNEDHEGAVSMMANLQRYREDYQRPSSTWATSSRSVYSLPRNDAPKYMQSKVPLSAASPAGSVDGYDSFENTNNKKKRKIPLSGSLGHSSTLSADMASMGISTAPDGEASQIDADCGIAHYYGSGSSAIPAGSSGAGISGAGRGRYGRNVARRQSGRSPLGLSLNGSNALLNGRSFYPKGDMAAVGGDYGRSVDFAKPSDQGIISAAIASAASLSTMSRKDQENHRLPDQASYKTAGSPRTKFTFSCESSPGKGISWPGYDLPTRDMAHFGTVSRNAQSQVGQNQRGLSTHGTQTSPITSGPTGQPGTKHAAVDQYASQTPVKPRRPLAKQYTMAARERRLRQDYNNYHHPPREEDVWVCEFCEYESIFGSQPEALIRQYEIKDRRERRRLAEKRRLLEKAKMKGRKGRKASKNTKAALVETQGHTNSKQNYDHQSLDQVSRDGQVTQSDDSGLDDYDDQPPDASAQTIPRIPPTSSLKPSRTLRPPSGSGDPRTNSSGLQVS